AEVDDGARVVRRTDPADLLVVQGAKHEPWCRNAFHIEGDLDDDSGDDDEDDDFDAEEDDDEDEDDEEDDDVETWQVRRAAPLKLACGLTSRPELLDCP